MCWTKLQKQNIIWYLDEKSSILFHHRDRKCDKSLKLQNYSHTKLIREIHFANYYWWTVDVYRMNRVIDKSNWHYHFITIMIGTINWLASLIDTIVIGIDRCRNRYDIWWHDMTWHHHSMMKSLYPTIILSTSRLFDSRTSFSSDALLQHDSIHQFFSIEQMTYKWTLTFVCFKADSLFRRKMLLLRRKTLAVVEKNLAMPLWNPFTKRRKRSSGWSPIAIHRVKEKRTIQSWENTSKLTALLTRNRYCPRYVLYSSYPKCYEMLELTYRFTNSTSLLKMPFVQITWKILQNWSIFSSHRLRWGRLCPTHSYIDACQFKRNEIWLL